MYYILDKDEALKYHTVCLYHSDTFNEQFLNEKYGDNWCVYTSNVYDIIVPIVEGNKARNATPKELLDLGYKTLNDGEYVFENNIVSIQKPNNKAIWNKEKNIWETDISKLSDGEVLLENQHIRYISRPNEYSVWNGKEWITDLNLLNLFNITNINLFKKQIINNGFDYNGLQISCDYESMFNLQQVYQTAKYVVDSTGKETNQIPEAMLSAIQFYPLTLNNEQYKAPIKLGGIYTSMSVDEIHALIITANVWLSNVEMICASFIEDGQETPITKKQIIDEINSIGLYKCYGGAL